MASWQRCRKPNPRFGNAGSFLSPAEMLMVKVPVENMMTPPCPAPERFIGTHVSESIASLLRPWLHDNRVLLVHDDRTWDAAGEAAATRLSSAGIAVTPLSLGHAPKALHDHALRVADAATGCDLILAVGAGTVNDICKSAAFARTIPYVALATAASMNGYCSTTASLEANGLKDSLPARAPVAVIADLAILAKAPIRLTRAGVGDTLCRTVVEADMLLSHLLFDTPYPRALFDRLRNHEARLLGGMLSAPGEESAYLMALVEALLDAGDAMREHSSSAVASQGEHMIAHTIEARYGGELQHVLHGEMVAVASLSSSQLQHRMLLVTPTVKPLPYTSKQFEGVFGPLLGAVLEQRYAKKLLSIEDSVALNQRLSKDWPAMRAALSEVMLPTATLENAFAHNGLHSKPEQLGIIEERYRYAVSYAHLSRERFTFLDLAAMNGKRIG